VFFFFLNGDVLFTKSPENLAVHKVRNVLFFRWFDPSFFFPHGTKHAQHSTKEKKYSHTTVPKNNHQTSVVFLVPILCVEACHHAFGQIKRIAGPKKKGENASQNNNVHQRKVEEKKRDSNVKDK